MKTSLKLLIAGLSAFSFGASSALPSLAQSQMMPNAETTPANSPTVPENQATPNNQSIPGTVAPANRPESPAPTDRDTGVPPVQNNQNTPNTNQRDNDGTNATPRNQATPNNQSVPGTVAPANRPESPAPTDRDTGVPPVQNNQNTPNTNQRDNDGRNSTPRNPATPENQSVPGTVSPANRPEPSNTQSFSSTGSEDKSIDQIVRTSTSFELFNALLRVAESEGILVGQLAGSSDYTVFAPTDEALAAIPPATFKALVQPENRDLLAQVLENHIVRGKVSSSDLAAKQVESLGGNPITAQGGAGSLTVGNARVIGADIQADNGIIHAIDQVILPADLQSKLTSFAQ